MRREIVLTKEGNAFIFVGANPLHAFNCIPDDDDDDDERGIIARKGCDKNVCATKECICSKYMCKECVRRGV